MNGDASLCVRSTIPLRGRQRGPAPKLIGPSASTGGLSDLASHRHRHFCRSGRLSLPNGGGGAAACLIPPLVVEDRFVMPCALPQPKLGRLRAGEFRDGRRTRPDLRRRSTGYALCGAGGTTPCRRLAIFFSATDGARLSFVAFEASSLPAPFRRPQPRSARQLAP